MFPLHQSRPQEYSMVGSRGTTREDLNQMVIDCFDITNKKIDLMGGTHQNIVISFDPVINEYKRAALQIGWGSVTKILLQFKEAFWNEEEKNIGFLFSGEIIPTWWTQLPNKYPLLTGWLGGP